MSTFTVTSGEAGLVRVFAISAPPDEFASRSEDGNMVWLTLALGLTGINDTAQLFAIKDLEDLGLVGYLRDGQGIPEEALAEDRAKLSALSGWVAVLPSSAFGQQAGTFDLAPELTLIGTYAEEGVDWSGTPIETPSAAPYSADPIPGKKPMSDARMGGMVATAVLLFLAIFVVIFVWLGG